MEDEGRARSPADFDLNTIKEEEFDTYSTYLVPDLPVPEGTPNRAEQTLPRNLVLKPSQALSDVSHDNF